jgi:hypothetical protein
MSKVLGVQSNMRRNEDKSWTPRFDLTPASKFGEISFIFGHGNHQFMGNDLHEIAAERLEGFDPEQDYILPVGDTSLVAVVFRVIEEMGMGPVRVLHWDGNKKAYDVIMV